ncbi:hypothetical protein P9112_006976 [Eukaryota sp. TZLM1-RC]
MFKDGQKKIHHEKVEAIQKFPRPYNKKTLRSLLGLVNFVRDFIPHFASITAPLYDLTAKDAKFHLSEHHLDSIQRLKNAVTKAVPLNLPSPSDHLIVITDASDEGIGGAIFKTSRTSFDPSIPLNEQDLVPLCFHSKKFLKSQKKLVYKHQGALCHRQHSHSMFTF